ncbi:ribosome small subunit-dependent GTPase A [Allorhizobium taibaishanense]|uniref:Small ribosomal subunit biogenesis GTPase RsgA n=1 Tax=Allorhizobium taibaishanense TaxID=887144 RepID=A0A7W6HNS9_9HYPH|nr:ribosome small subunit-dependent GTPase A [Allorhizobium taibaishanense]MBB4008576.1 ribosome biogenesis GTPase [Allorhizobium taibaishanense]
MLAQPDQFCSTTRHYPGESPLDDRSRLLRIRRLTVPSLAALGWADFFADQLTPEDEGLVPRRVAAVHRARVDVIDADGLKDLVLPHKSSTADFAVGDWVLVDAATDAFVRLLERRTVFQRRTEGRHGQQLAAANVDTLFIVTSCNADFNPARLERYLVMANQSGADPVLVLTKADIADDRETYIAQAESLQRGVPVIIVNARAPDAAAMLAPFCGVGKTVALVGSSGVGKSTLVNTLAGLQPETEQKTGGIREHDAKGRHTTTARSLHAIAGGGWVIDTPGIRTLYVSDVTDGLDTLFSEITDLAPLCRFRDCTHVHEPGCAVQAAISAGTLAPERLERWRILSAESRERTPVATGPRGNKTFRKSKR